MKDISFDQIQKIKKLIDNALAGGANPIAAFDADGTLWDTDLGENFFKFQAAQKLIPDLPESPWQHYLKMHDEDILAAYLWLAQVNAGFPLETVRQWAKDAVQSQPLPVFAGVRDIINHLLRRDVKVYVVTASVKWAVEPGAEILGIPKEQVIGIETVIKDNVVTDESNGLITWREGKVTGLMQATDRKAPFLTAGNTMGDLALLDCSTHLRFVNAAAPEGHVNYESERKLVEIAQKRGWLFHVYR